MPYRKNILARPLRFLFNNKLMITQVRLLLLSIIIISGNLFAADTSTTASKPVQQFVTVEENVKLEVLDWGGSGRPLVLLAGLGNDARVFDKLAEKLTPKYHVYGITRRGFGASSVPASGYSSARLGEDVIAVLNELKIERPILAGHSIAGSELSYIGSSHPERVAALIYLDAAGPYAFYDESTGDQMNLLIDSIELRTQLEQLPSADARNLKQLNQELLASVQRIEKELRDQQEFLKEMPEQPKGIAGNSQPAVPNSRHQVLGGLRKYKDIRVPVLAICAVPDFGPELSKTIAERLASKSTAQADAFARGIPSARVVRIAHASHYIFKSNESDVLREIEEFIGKIPPE
jgi:pimeloyl-ACP methyl ester carboxylesterase